MGIYDTYEDVQMKVEEKDSMDHFSIGDKVTLCDGVYVGHEGIIVIVKGVFVAKFNYITTKWGEELSPKVVLDPHDPFKAILALKKTSLDH